MKKQILLFCRDKQQFGMTVSDPPISEIKNGVLSVNAIVSNILEEISDPNRKHGDFICLTDHAPVINLDQGVYIRAVAVDAVMIAMTETKSGLALPNKQLQVPMGIA